MNSVEHNLSVKGSLALGNLTTSDDQLNGTSNVNRISQNIETYFPNGASQANGIPRADNALPKLNETVPRGSLPMAICGMALRLPGGLESPQELWNFLLAKGDARSHVPDSRYNILAYHSKSGRPGTVATDYGYFLDDSVKLGCLDASRFSLSRAELELCDPQQRRMLEVVREAFDDAGEIAFKVGALF